MSVFHQNVYSHYYWYVCMHLAAQGLEAWSSVWQCSEVVQHRSHEALGGQTHLQRLSLILVRYKFLSGSVSHCTMSLSPTCTHNHGICHKDLTRAEEKLLQDCEVNKPLLVRKVPSHKYFVI